MRQINDDERGGVAVLALAAIPFVLWFYPGLLVGWFIDAALRPLVGETTAHVIGGAVWLVSITGAVWFLMRAALAWVGVRWRVSWFDDAVILIAAIALARR